MKLTRSRVRDIVIDAIVDVTSLSTEEEDEIADIVVERLADECPELIEDEDEGLENEDE
jgi:hypothetical protein